MAGTARHINGKRDATLIPPRLCATVQTPSCRSFTIDHIDVLLNCKLQDRLYTSERHFAQFKIATLAVCKPHQSRNRRLSSRLPWLTTPLEGRSNAPLIRTLPIRRRDACTTFAPPRRHHRKHRLTYTRRTGHNQCCRAHCAIHLYSRRRFAQASSINTSATERRRFRPKPLLERLHSSMLPRPACWPGARRSRRHSARKHRRILLHPVDPMDLKHWELIHPNHNFARRRSRYIETKIAKSAE